MIENFFKDESTPKKNDKFLHFFNELGLHNSDIPIEGNARQGFIGDTDVIVAQGENNDLIIESIRTNIKKRNTGSAGRALDKIINIANKLDLILRIKILPENQDSSGLNSEELKMFYEKRGFVFNEKNEAIKEPMI